MSLEQDIYTHRDQEQPVPIIDQDITYEEVGELLADIDCRQKAIRTISDTDLLIACFADARSDLHQLRKNALGKNPVVEPTTDKELIVAHVGNLVRVHLEQLSSKNHPQPNEPGHFKINHTRGEEDDIYSSRLALIETNLSERRTAVTREVASWDSRFAEENLKIIQREARITLSKLPNATLFFQELDTKFPRESIHELFARLPIQIRRDIVEKYRKASTIIATTALNLLYMYGSDAAGAVGEKVGSQIDIEKFIDSKLLFGLVIVSYGMWIGGMIKSSNENYKAVKNGEAGLSLLGTILYNKANKIHPDNEKLQKLAVQMGQILPELGREVFFIVAALIVSHGINPESDTMLIAANLLAGTYERGVALALYIRRTVKQLRAEGNTPTEIRQFLIQDLQHSAKENWSQKAQVARYVIDTVQQPEFKETVLGIMENFTDDYLDKHIFQNKLPTPAD